ncbi:putative restriction endonuclease [Balneicella halophila]|uniref:Putative restriction endonuclease n=1 Tax=Balneicella halophila TaxID=1537566 RepID=A0A7L4UME6_BALHA|nr:HNH endonuclease [Balneicella halophila]PVX48856.1 putative restriction endonuclease [Balneicella halophila]
MKRRNWTREELIVAFNLYCKIEFSKINYRHHLIIKLSEAINRTPSAVAWKLVNFASLDPSLTRRGIKGATNTGKLDKIIFEEFTNNWEDLAYESELLLSKFLKEEINLDDEIDFDEGKEVKRTVKVRVNQSFFRSTVLSSYDFKCCLTGIDIPELLIASHIVPWSKDKKNRLNPQNGLCLNNLHDKAFDKGLLTFDRNFKLVLSHSLKKSDEEFAKKYFQEFEGKELRLPKRFIPDEQFLDFHNKNIFIQ